MHWKLQKKRHGDKISLKTCSVTFQFLIQRILITILVIFFRVLLICQEFKKEIVRMIYKMSIKPPIPLWIWNYVPKMLEIIDFQESTANDLTDQEYDLTEGKQIFF